MFSGLIPLLFLCFLASADGTRGNVIAGSSPQNRFSRQVIASVMFGGAIPGKEPHLLEFHGTNCEHCEAMVPHIRKLRNVFRLNVKRYMVWEGTSAFYLMSILDGDTGCRGLPFFYNRKTGATICGATTWDNFRDWATQRCPKLLAKALDEHVIRPHVGPNFKLFFGDEDDEIKPRKHKGGLLLERLKNQAGWGQHDEDNTNTDPSGETMEETSA